MNENWMASWIWCASAAEKPNVYVEARTTFVLAERPDAAALRITANQEYIVYVNGLYVGRGPSPCDIEWQYYDMYDAVPYLHKGVNTLAVVAYNFGVKQIATQQFQGPGGLLVQLDGDAGGSAFHIASDGEWRCRRSPRWVADVSRLHHWNGFKEIYLSDMEDGWEQTNYDDRAWEQAHVIAPALDEGSPWPRLIAREIPFLHEEAIVPQAIVRVELNAGKASGWGTTLDGQIEWTDSERTHTQSTNLGAAAHHDATAVGQPSDSDSRLDVDPLTNRAQERTRGARTSTGRTEAYLLDASIPGSIPCIVFDFGHEVVGYMELMADAPEGGVVQLHYGESLELQLTDTFRLKKGENRLAPFGRRAFRYVKVSVQAASELVTVRNIHLTQVHYPFKQTGAFRSSDPLLNRIWEVGEFTTRMNSQDHLEDCPWREKALWIADAVIMGRVIYHTYGDSALLRKCLLQAARIQNEDGSIPGTGPERNSFLLPDFNAHWLFGVYDYWTYTADAPFLAEVRQPVQKLMHWFLTQQDNTGLFARANRPGWWCFIDWSDDMDKRDRVTAISCFMYKALLQAADLADAWGDSEQARKWRISASGLRSSIRRHLWRTEAEAFADCLTEEGLSSVLTLQTNYAAIWSGIMDSGEADRFLERYAYSGQLPTIRGAFFYHIVLETLLERGKTKQALDAMRSYWGGMLERGATTWWEVFDPESPSCTIPGAYQGNTPTYLMDHVPVSLCHGWGSSPTYLLTQRVLGLSVSLLGSGKIRFAPTESGLQWAEGEVPTPRGVICARWSRNEDGTTSCTVAVPDGVSWETDLPYGWQLVVTTY